MRKPTKTRAITPWLGRIAGAVIAVPLLSIALIAVSAAESDTRQVDQVDIDVAAQTPAAYLRFKGISSYAEIPNSPVFSVSATGLTVAVWMRPDTLSSPVTEGSLKNEKYVHWLGKGQLGTQEWTFRMYSQTTPPGPRGNRISFYVFNPEGGRGCGSYFQDPVAVGQWIHVVGVVDARARQTAIYKNGQFRHSDSYSGQIRPAHKAAPLRLGTQSLASFFKGAIGLVRVWSRPLSASEIQKLYTSNVAPRQGLVAQYKLEEGRGTVIHDTVGGHNGNLFNAAWAQGRGPIGNATGTSGGGC